MDAQETPEEHGPLSIQQWLQQGETLYESAIKEYQEIEAKIEEMQVALAAKRAEVNHVAQVIGRPLLDAKRTPTTEIIPAQPIDEQRPLPTRSTVNIARALTGRFVR